MLDHSEQAPLPRYLKIYLGQTFREVHRRQLAKSLIIAEALGFISLNDLERRTIWRALGDKPLSLPSALRLTTEGYALANYAWLTNHLSGCNISFKVVG